MVEWTECSLEEIGEIIGGATPSTKREDYYGGSIPWITPKDLSSFEGRFISRGERNITDEGFRSCSTKMLPKGAVLFTSRAPIGYVAIASQSVCTNQGFKSVVTNERADPLFVYYLLKHNREYIERLGSGTTFKEVSGKVMQSVKVRVPQDVHYQKKIASILDSLDSQIETNKQINDNLLAQMQLLYQNLLDSCVCSPIRLEEVSQKIAMGPFGSNIKVSTFVSEGVPIISGNHLRSVFLEEPSYNYITEEHAQKLKNSMVYPRDIVFTHAGNIGQVAMIPQGSDYPYYMISQRQFYMRCDETKVIPELVLFFFHSREGKGKLLANANSTGVPSIAQPSTHLKNIEMSMPNKTDQDEWYKTIKPMVDMYVALSQENKRLISLRDSLLPHLMSGELDVSDIQL